MPNIEKKKKSKKKETILWQQFPNLNGDLYRGMAVDFNLEWVSTYYCSSTPLFGAAKSFASPSNSHPYQNATIFNINPQLSSVEVAGDVSWISPFPQEAEVIVKINKCEIFYDPIQLMTCATSCKSLDCYHARTCLKEVTLVDLDEWRNEYYWDEQKRENLKKKILFILSKLEKKVEKGLVCFFFQENVCFLC